MTNRERLMRDINNMTDEEFANLLCGDLNSCEFCIYNELESCDFIVTDCSDAIVEWLKKEV